jgi:hypothetical protein
MRLSKRWNYLSQRHTAWPKLQSRHLIVRLETNVYEHKTSLTRRLAVTPANLARLVASATWNKVVDITLQATYGYQETFNTPALATAFLDQVATGLRHVESMQLDADVSVLCQANLMFENCKARLRALVFNPPLLFGHHEDSLSASQPMPALAQLTNLRVLMLSLTPHWPSMMALVHLEYLHIVVAVRKDLVSEWTDDMATTLLALRATLVSLSVQLSTYYSELDRYALLGAIERGGTHLTTLECSAGLAQCDADLFSLVAHLPRLERLSCYLLFSYNEEDDDKSIKAGKDAAMCQLDARSPAQERSHLRSLSIYSHGDYSHVKPRTLDLTRTLACCPQLESLSIHAAETGPQIKVQLPAPADTVLARLIDVRTSGKCFFNAASSDSLVDCAPNVQHLQLVDVIKYMHGDEAVRNLATLVTCLAHAKYLRELAIWHYRGESRLFQPRHILPLLQPHHHEWNKLTLYIAPGQARQVQQANPMFASKPQSYKLYQAQQHSATQALSPVAAAFRVERALFAPPSRKAQQEDSDDYEALCPPISSRTLYRATNANLAMWIQF